MTTARFVLWIVLALATVPFGNWLGNYMEDRRTENLFASLKKTETENKVYMEGFTAALEQKTEEANQATHALAQAAIDNVWASAYNALSLGMTKGEVVRFLGTPGQTKAEFGQIEIVAFKGNILLTFESGRLVGKTRE